MSGDIFKQITQRDKRNVFFRDQFDSVHTIDGQAMPVIMDNYELIEREKRFSQNMDGVNTMRILIYVDADDFGELPGQGVSLDLDGNMFFVEEAIDEGGIYAITLNATDVIGKSWRP